MSVGVNVITVEEGCGLAGRFSGGSITVDGSKFHPKPSQGVTIAMWVQISRTEGEQVLFSTSATNSTDVNYYLASSNGKVTWCHKNEKNTTLFETTSNTTRITAGQWAHIAVTYDGSKGK